MSELKPCPFCGNADVALMTRRGKDGWRDRYYVLCDYNDGGCGASGQWSHYEYLAAEAWNRRLQSFPAADVLPVVHGKWTEDDACPYCGCYVPTDDAHDAIFKSEVHYCYYCGAKMDEEKEHG